jgi:ABC-type lipoprotein release transport system permease subunit
VFAAQLAWLRAAVNSVTGFLVAGLVAMTFVLTSYPFQPQGQLLGLIGVLAAITVGVVAVIAVSSSRDEVLSRLNKTEPDRLTFDREFLTTMVTVVVPLVGLVASLSYGMSDLLRSWLEPLFR